MRELCDRISSRYFCVQGVGVCAWWALLLGYPAAVDVFFPADRPAWLVPSLMVPDLVVVGLGSIGVALLVRKGHPGARVLAWGVAVALLYATGMVIHWTLATRSVHVSSVLMAIATLLSVHCAILTTSEPLCIFRKHRGGALSAAAHSVVQIGVFWGLFLGVLPWWIVEAQVEVGVPLFSFPGQWAVAGGLFAAGGGLGLASALTMVRSGQGTPLPLDGARALVTTGPYGWVRNPMAVGGIGQGIAVGIGLGSVAVIAYAVVGAVIWHAMVRPVEELYLASEFDEEYERYRRTVRCWWGRRE